MHQIYALYIRVSTDAQAEEGYSIGAQTERLTAYCTAMGYSHYDTYIDAGFSGSNLDRPRMQELIFDVQNGKIAAVLVYKLDRLSRSQKDTLHLIEDVFLPHKVDFISLGESIDTSTPYGRAMIGILSAFAQLERENIFMRTRMGMLERVKNGYWMGGGNPPFGYDYDPQKGILVENSRSNDVITAFSMYIAGENMASIAKTLGFSHDRMVTQLLKRRSYLGLIPYKGMEYQGRHKALIDEETYLLAMQKMQQRTGSRTRLDNVHLLSGLIFCGHCGSRMRYIKWGKKGYKLRCYAQDTSKAYMNHGLCSVCEASAVWADETEQLVLTDLLNLSVKIEQNKQISVVEFSSQTIDFRIQAQERKLKRLYHLYADASDELLLDSIETVKSSLKTLQIEKISHQKSQNSEKYKEWLSNELIQLSEAWPHLSCIEKKRMLRDCVEKIVIVGDSVKVYYTLDFA